MKKFLFPLLSAGLMMVSCNNVDEPSAQDGKKQTTSLSIALPDAFRSPATRVGYSYVDSAMGSLTNQPGEDMTVYVEIFYGTNSVFSGNQTITTDARSATFNPTLVTGETYRLVAWAQYGSTTVTDLTDIDILQAINDESTDAFYYTGDQVAAATMSATMARPFGKLRLVAEDYGTMNTQTGKAVESVKVTYTSGRPTKFDATTGEFSVDGTVMEYTADMNTYGNDAAGTQTLFADYIAVSANGSTMFPFDIEVTYDDGATYTRSFSQDIPVKRNGLTTMTGNFFTTSTTFTLTVNDNFDSVESVEYWDGEPSTDVTPNPLGDYEIATAADLLWFSNEVNGGKNFSGETVVLTADIDLAYVEWPPIGNATTTFQGTFDGDGHIINNLVVTADLTNADANNCKGLFGNMDNNGTIKNFTINNALVSGSHFVAVVCGRPYIGAIENVNVTGHVELNGDRYTGTIAGYGYNTVADCNVDVDASSYVMGTTAYAGGISGWNGESGGVARTVISSCNTNIDVTANSYAGGITGLCHYGNTIENSTATCDVTMTIDLANANASDLYGVGGIAGITVDSTAGQLCTINNCSFTGTITNSINIDNIIHGGVVGGSHAGIFNQTNLVIGNCVINGVIVTE